MLVSHVEKIKGTNADATGPGWRSIRFGLHGDRLGFTITETTVDAGVDNILWYQNHIEAVYCISGEGEVEDLETGIVHNIVPGSFYALDKHYRHRFRSHTEMKFVCAFPPCWPGRRRMTANGVIRRSKSSPQQRGA